MMLRENWVICNKDSAVEGPKHNITRGDVCPGEPGRGACKKCSAYRIGFKEGQDAFYDRILDHKQSL